MAEIAWVELVPPPAPAAGAAGAAEGHSPGVHIFEWPAMAGATTDTGKWLPIPNYSEVSIAIDLGTIGTTTISIEGANEYGTPTQPYVLNDPQGTPLSGLTTEKIEQVLETPQQIRPVLSGGSGTGITVRARITTNRRGGAA